jgi:phenylacetic acid degradation operon negative regulatory protein
MVAAGELSTAGDGRYELIGHLRTRQARQDQSRAGLTNADWDGSWEMAAVTAESRSPSERNELRLAMGRLRLAELREGLWLRPANLPADRLADDRSAIEQWVTNFTGAPDQPKLIASRLWDLDQWSKHAHELLNDVTTGATELRRAATSDDTDGGLGHWFTINAAVLRHLQADPLLPSELLPRNWPGQRLRDRYERFDTLFVQRWRSWLAA